MRVRKWLYTWDNGKSYTIKYKQIHLCNSQNEETILNVWNKCEEAGWELPEILKIKEENKQRGFNENRFIACNNGLYFISKKSKYYGSHKDKNEIIRMRDYLIEHDWDMTNAWWTVKPRKKTNLPKYITKAGKDKYTIQKNGKKWGTFNTIQDAVEERDLLIQYDWTYDFIDLV